MTAVDADTETVPCRGRVVCSLLTTFLLGTVFLQATRGDRQPSFTQMDLEMTFADQDVIMKLTEDLVRAVFQEVFV